MKNTYNKARRFIYQNARPIDLARWQYHFEDGKKEDVLHNLSYYQNDDGGFGHALENDYWNPNSTPIQTWAAIEILREIHFTNHNHPIIKGILHYLESGQDFNKQFWFRVVPSNNNYPHAPWWAANDNYANENSYNPTAYLASFYLLYGLKKHHFYDITKQIVINAASYYLECNQPESHELNCFINMLNHVKSANLHCIFDKEKFEEKLKFDTSNSIEKNTEIWATEYVCKPSRFIKSKNSIFYTGNEELCKYECAFIKDTQLADGSWPITWKWADYNDAFAICTNHWKSNFIIENLLFLKTFEF